MLQAATAFGGGLAIQQSLEQVRLPKLRRAPDGAATFKLSVRVLGASVPGLQAPGVASRQRPFLEAALGGTKKETEFADFDSSLDSIQAGAGAHECPWRFSDTLTFATKLQDVAGPGLKLDLRAKKELSLGFLQLELQAGDIGAGAVDLKQRALPACVQERRDADGRVVAWSSPMVLVPLSHVRGGICGEQGGLGEAVAHVALVFSVDSDPEEILAAVGAGQQRMIERTFEQAGRKLEAGQRQLGEQMANTKQSLGEAKRKLEEHGSRTLQKLGEAERQIDQKLMHMEQKLAEPVVQWATKMEKMISPVDGPSAATRAEARSASTPRLQHPLPDPDFDPQGWVCRFGPNGQAYWHHQALGPAPWDTAAEGSPQARGPAGAAGSGAARAGGTAERGDPCFFPQPPASIKRMSNALQASVSWLISEDAGSHAARPGHPRGAPPHGGSAGGMPSPDEAPEGWVCHQGADGRVFWHNLALGPPPWSSAQAVGSPEAVPPFR